MPEVATIRNRSVDVRKTVASSEYPSPGTRNYGAEMANLREMINICHDAGYVVDQNLLAHLATAITRILVRDGICFFPKLGVFKAKHYLGKLPFHRVYFATSPFLDIACYAKYGTFESREYLRTGLSVNTQDVELMELFNELLAASGENRIDG